MLNLSDKINLKITDKYVGLSNLSIYYTWKNIKNLYKNNKLKISFSTLNEEFQLPDRSYPVSDNQVYFNYTIKQHETVTSVRIYVNKIIFIFFKNLHLD